MAEPEAEAGAVEIASASHVLELMAHRIEDVGLYSGTDPHYDRGVAVPPTIIGAWDWARIQTRPDWRIRTGPMSDEWHAACMAALHRLAVHLAEDRLAAPSWWHAGQLAWETRVVSVWGEMRTADEVVAAVREATPARPAPEES